MLFPSLLLVVCLLTEGELVVALRSGGRNLTTAQAAEAIYGYAVGVDLTRRDLQADAKKGGRPWDTAKGFDFSGPVGAITPKSVIDYTTANGKFVTKVNGAVKQQAQISDMIWSIPEMISSLSQLYTLMPGDILFTGN
jgi:fumarylpyruvate hydrolase